MATFDEIKEVRLTLDDPPGFINIISIATETAADMPTDPEPQTAYHIQADDSYMSTDKQHGCTPADYEKQELLFHDDTIANIIDNFPDNIYSKLIRLALPKLLRRMEIVQNQTGTEDVKFISLKERFDAYKKMLDEYDDEESAAAGTNTGKYLKTAKPTIAGGDL